MGLSKWPDEPKKNRGKRSTDNTVLVAFEEPVLVAIETQKAIGIKYESTGDKIDLWIPKSILEDCPKRFEWIDSIEVPFWFADDNNLDYE